MRSTLLPVLLCILKYAGVAFAACTVSKYEEGYGDRVQCSNSTLSSVVDQSTPNVAALMIFHSELSLIPERFFLRYAKTLASLNIHQCRISEIRPEAFDGLPFLRKLSLPNNNLTRVEEDWFKDLVALEQLDLSFNLIERIEPKVFGRLSNLRRLDVRENRLTCLDPNALQPMAGITKILFSGNPLRFLCRGKLTLWLRDHGVNYNDDQSRKDGWLDSLLWLCAIDDPKVAESEILTKECIILNLFNQLRTALISAESYPLSVPRECTNARNVLTNCIVTRGRQTQGELTNGNAVQKLLLQLREVKSVV